MIGQLTKKTAAIRAEPTEPPRKSAERILDSQVHQIKPITLRTSASNFFGTNANPEEQSDPDPSSPVAPPANLKSRSQLLHFIDPLVLMFNEADFDALAAALADACSRDLMLHAELDAKYSNTGRPTNPPVRACGMPSVLLLWMLLHEAHPDGVMQIVDKRICYRTVLRDGSMAEPPASASSSIQIQSNASRDGDFCTSSSSSSSSSSNSSSASQGSSASSRHSSNRPVSIVEIVIKLSGACITTRPLHGLFHDLARGPLPSLSITPRSSGTENASTASDESAQVDSVASYISACLSRRDLSPASRAQRRGNENDHPVVKKARFEASNMGSVRTQPPAEARRGDDREVGLGSLHEHSRRYLLEMRLVYNECDVITDWTATVLAAEDF
jgi:hypothetical protein